MRWLTIFCLWTFGALGAASAEENISDQARDVLRQHCLRCHNGPGSEGGDFSVLDVASLKDEFMYVVEKELEASELYQKVVRDEMPPRSVSERVSHRDGEILRAWIEAGAPDFNPPSQRDFITFQATMEAVAQRLREADEADRPFLRFFTLHNLHNSPKVFAQDLRIYRAALSKALNSLSSKAAIALPTSIDDAETLYVIDLRRYGWTESQWNELLRRYPYGLGYSDLRDDALHELDREITSMTQSTMPLLRADWFIANATRPPLYDVLLQLPDADEALERRLGVDIARNFLAPTSEGIARAAFEKSGVSGQNRLVERSDSREGMYWKSYDFRQDNGRSRLTRFPLGPLNLFPEGGHPFADQAFEHDGGEIIFRLPNGLQAYMLIDGQGRKIDEGPIDVVSDALKTSGTPAIVNGVSCMSCHKHGMIDFADTVRGRTAVFGEAERHLDRLHPPLDEMNRLLAADREVFMKALAECIGPFLQVGVDQEKPLEEFVEPVGQAARWHRLGYLDLETIAQELDISDAGALRERVGIKKFKQLGLDALLEGGVISRAQWEAFNGPSLMQELARELRYTPRREL